MQKFFYLLVILLFGCSNADDAFFTKEGIPSIVTKYGACVKRVYRMAKQYSVEGLANEMFCDFTAVVCPSIWAFTAIVGCRY